MVAQGQSVSTKKVKLSRGQVLGKMLPYSVDAELNESIHNLVLQHRGNNILLARAFKRALFVTFFKRFSSMGQKDMCHM